MAAQPSFRVLDGGVGVEVEESSGSGLQLGPILRKYTAAKLNMKGARRVTTVEVAQLWDALGLLRSLQYDIAQFNSMAAAGQDNSPSALRYACYRLTRQAAAFGARVPRPGSGVLVAAPGLDELVSFVEGAHADRLAASRALLASGVVDFASLAELFLPGADLLDRGAATGLFGIPTAFRVRAAFFSRGKSLLGAVSTFFAAVECVIATPDGRFCVVESHVPIPEFAGTRSTTDGLDHFVTLSDSTRAELAARGSRYVELCCAPAGAFVEYIPSAFMAAPKPGSSQHRGLSRARGGGRMMVDAAAASAHGVGCARAEGAAADAVRGAMRLVATRATRASVSAAAAPPATPDGSGVGGGPGSGQAAASEEEASLELLILPAPLPENLLPLTWPVVAGFSFTSKCWGTALVSGLTAVSFNDSAFDRLVLPSARKRLIQALVLSHGGAGGSGSGAARPAKTDISAFSCFFFVFFFVSFSFLFCQSRDSSQSLAKGRARFCCSTARRGAEKRSPPKRLRSCSVARCIASPWASWARRRRRWRSASRTFLSCARPGGRSSSSTRRRVRCVALRARESAASVPSPQPG